MQVVSIAYAKQRSYTYNNEAIMVLSELRAAAKTSREGWLVSWTPQGYIISLGVLPEMCLESERAGRKRVRYFQKLDSAARVMADNLGIKEYTVRGRIPGQLFKTEIR